MIDSSLSEQVEHKRFGGIKQVGRPGIQLRTGQRVQVFPVGVNDMADQNDVDLDSVIDRLLEVRGSRPGKQVQLLETEIRYLCTKAREIFISQPILLELEAPIKVIAYCTTKVQKTVWLIPCAYFIDLWRYSRSILRSPPSVRVRGVSSGSQLPFPGRLC